MYHQVQILWDPSLKTFVIQSLDGSPLPTKLQLVLAKSETSESSQPTDTVPTKDPSAPLGSFHNPVPFESSPQSVMPGPPPHIWQRDPTAPLGSFRNPLPRVTHKRNKTVATDFASNTPVTSTSGQEQSASRPPKSGESVAEEPASLRTKSKPETHKENQQSSKTDKTTATQRQPQDQPQHGKQKQKREGRHVHFEGDEQPAQTAAKATGKMSASNYPNTQQVTLASQLPAPITHLHLLTILDSTTNTTRPNLPHRIHPNPQQNALHGLPQATTVSILHILQKHGTSAPDNGPSVSGARPVPPSSTTPESTTATPASTKKPVNLREKTNVSQPTRAPYARIILRDSRSGDTMFAKLVRG
ncbi:MAG: hypothetical protein Q9218_006598 [Villophora microphyllina]